MISARLSDPDTMSAHMDGFLNTVVQSDYEQNDSRKADYIKNRPFYAGDLVETEIFDVCSLVDGAGYSWVKNGEIYIAGFAANQLIIIDNPPIVGQKCDIKYNGETYKCIAKDGSDIFGEGFIYIGDNIDEVESGSITYGFSIITVPYAGLDSSDTSGRHFIYIAADFNGSAPTELKVLGQEQEIKKIDPQFIDFPVETDPTVPEWAKQPEKPVYTVNEIQGAKQKDYIITFTGSDVDGGILESDLSKTNESVNAINEAYRNGATFYALYNNKLIPSTFVSSSITNGAAFVHIIYFEYISTPSVNNKSFHHCTIVFKTMVPIESPTSKLSATLNLVEIRNDDRLLSNSINPVQNKVVTAKFNDIEKKITNLPGDGLESDSDGKVNVTWIMKSSTEGSTKKFKITVDDSGTLSTTEVT